MNVKLEKESMKGKQRESKLPSYRKKALDLLGKTRTKGMEAFSACLFDYEMTLITLLLAELDETGDLHGREMSRLPSCRCSAGAFAEAPVHARYRESVTDYLADRLRLKTALKQLLRSEGDRFGTLGRGE